MPGSSAAMRPAALAALDLAPLAALPARMLSAGQRRRLGLARLALIWAPLWLLDEPTIGLDAGAIDLFGGMLAAHRALGGVIVAATLARCRYRGRRSFVSGDRLFCPGGARAPSLAAARRRPAGSVAVLPTRRSCSRWRSARGRRALGRIAPGVVWVCALLAAVLPLDRLFGADFEDSSLGGLLLGSAGFGGRRGESAGPG